VGWRQGVEAIVMSKQTLYDGDTFEHRGHTFKLTIERDDDMGEPWKEHDGHGIVSDWTTRDKAPGERVLVEDRNHKRYYDVKASTKLARKDGWGCSHSTMDEVDGKRVFKSGHKTKGEAIACAVDEDFERMRAWCNDDWYWAYAMVRLLDEDGEETSEYDTLSGVESDAGSYWDEVARELADQIVSRIEVETPDAVLSEN
jgi:hypothetical protein